MNYLPGKVHLFWRKRPSGALAEICGPVRIYAAPGRAWILPIPRAEELSVVAFYSLQLILAVGFGLLWLVSELRGVSWGDWLLWAFLGGEGLLLMSMLVVLVTKGIFRRRDEAWLQAICGKGTGIEVDEDALAARQEQGVDGKGKRLRIRLPLCDGEAVIELSRRQHRGLLARIRTSAAIKNRS